MRIQNFGVTNKEHYGMLWYFLEWSIADLEDKCWIAVATGNIHMKTSQEQK